MPGTSAASLGEDDRDMGAPEAGETQHCTGTSVQSMNTKRADSERTRRQWSQAPGMGGLGCTSAPRGRLPGEAGRPQTRGVQGSALVLAHLFGFYVIHSKGFLVSGCDR